MRIFLAGATGAIGRPLVAALLDAGHQVTGMTRDEARAESLRSRGASAVVCDVFDEAGLLAAMKAAEPEVLVHELTSLPQAMKLSRRANPYEATNRVRTEGTRNLLAAASAAGARRVVAQSIAFIYEPEGDWVKDEEAPVMSEPPKPFDSAVEGVRDLERQVLSAPGMDGLVLRYGWFYGPGTYYAPNGVMAEMARKRQLPVLGNGEGVSSFIHVGDAAAATVAACERGPAGIYNVADDDPAPAREWTPAFCEAVDAPKPRRVPVWIARLVAGGFAAEGARLRGASNAKARRELAWAPRYSSWRQGFREGLS